MIVFDCPACKSKLQVADEHAGKTMRCPKCQQTAPIPSADANAIAAEPLPAPAPAPPVAKPAPAWDQSDAKDDRDDRDDRDRDDDRRRRRRRRERDDREDDRPPPRKSGGIGLVLTLVIVGVCLCFVGPICLALLIPAVQKVREAAARTQSTNNLKQISLGFYSFHDANKRLPFNGSDLPPGAFPAYSKNAVANQFTSGSWGFQILPFVDQQRMFNQVDRNSPVVPYMCPGRGRPTIEAGGGAWSDYFYNNYLNDFEHASRPDSPDRKRTLVGITDGTSNTILLGHGSIPTNQYSFIAGVPFCSNVFNGGTVGTMRSGDDAPLGANPVGVSLQRDQFAAPGIGAWGGPFPQGALMAMGDATVRMFPYQTANFGQFLTPCGGEGVILPP